MPKYNKHIALLFTFYLSAQPAYAHWGTHAESPCHTKKSQHQSRLLLKEWQALKYSWYQELPQDKEASYNLVSDFFSRPDIKNQVKQFRLKNSAKIKQTRRCQLQDWLVTTDQLPDLSKYKKVSDKSAVFVKENYGIYTQFTFSPLEIVNIVQNMMLAQFMKASEMGLFYLRRNIGGSLALSERLPDNNVGERWRVWLDSYDYILAVDMSISPEMYKIHGLWKRIQEEKGNKDEP